MAAKDFTANQIRTAKLILTGGIGVGNLGLSVYTGSLASDHVGTSTDTQMYSEVGGDVTVFISGSGLTRGKPTAVGGTVLFGGDMAVSGTIYASGSHRHNPFGTISGSIHQTRDGQSYLLAGANTTITSASNGQITIASTGGAANAFSTFDVNDADSGFTWGTADVVADSDTDTLKLVAGTGIELKSDSSSDAIRITASDAALKYYDEFSGSPVQPPGASGSHSVVIGDGSRTLLTGTGSIILGTSNTGSAEYGAIGGGKDHLISSSSNYGTIGGGYNNIITSSVTSARVDHGTIGGGTSNKISATAQGKGAEESVIAGGDKNYLFGAAASSILGGRSNLASALDNISLVGQFLTASQHDQVILGFGEAFGGTGDLAVIASGTFFKSAGATGGAISGSIFHTKDGLSYLQAGPNVTITSGSNGQITIEAASSTSAEWTDGGTFLRPSDSSGAEHVVIGGTSIGAADILLSADGGAVFNQQSGAVDFRVESNNKQYALFVSGNTDQVLILSGGSSPGSVDESKGADVAFYVSGSGFSKGTSYRGASLFGGDIISSGTVSSVLGLSGSLTRLSDGKSFIEAGANITVTSASNGAITIASTQATTEWTDGGTFLRPSDASGAQHIVIGGTSLGAADILLESGGAAVFNEQAGSKDFRVESKNNPYALFISGNNDQVLILSGGSPGTPNDAAGADVAFYVSGSKDGRLLGERGTSLFGGDTFVSGTLFAGGIAGGAITGSITRTITGRSYLQAGENITIASASDGQITIAGTAGYAGFFLEDNAGTEVNINSNNEIKFVEGAGIDITWTDTSTGNDADPYDMSFNVTGSATAALYSLMGPHMLVSASYGSEPAQNGVVGMKDDVDEAGLSGYTGLANGPVAAFTQNGTKPPAIGFRLNIPENASTVQFQMLANPNFPGGASGAVQFVVAGRCHSDNVSLDARNNTATAGKWLRDNIGSSGWQNFGPAPFLPTGTNNRILTGSTYNISDLVNAGDVNNIGPGSVVDIAIARNRTSNGDNDFGTTTDNFNNVVFVTWVKAVFGF